MKKALRIVTWSAFVFYCLVLVYIFIMDRIPHINIRWLSIREFFIFSNFIPFKTLFEYIIKIKNDQINIDTAIINLVGNMIVFLPMGCFLPWLFKKFKSFKNTVLLVGGIVVAIEIMQIVFGVGSFDVDDIILNVGGAMLGYAITSIPFIIKIRDYIFP